ncbi:protein BIG GRAIN 1-like [Asparagus officinalis]|uniref:protein BIG GRAIN 1-like n=1 Tax=Asparagus officinalis TaxID=4686 RepID=UPI00098E59E8|nr:protein BIG GRAIN 1-like [Asparagus officinalis]
MGASMITLFSHNSDPSFSSSLLDAIDRSIDESDSGSLTRGAPDFSKTTTKTRSPIDSPVTTLSYYSYSSGAADSARFTRPKPVRIQTRKNPIRIDPLPPEPLTLAKKPPEEGSPISLRSEKTEDLRSRRRSLAAASPSPRSARRRVVRTPASLLSKTPSTRGSKRPARSVRFSPVGVIVGEDCRPCGEKAVFDGEEAAAEERRRRRRRAVEEMMKGFEESGDESDGSDDLFELENLGGVSINGGLGLGFRDELPVFGTTDLGMNCAIAKGLVV